MSSINRNVVFTLISGTFLKILLFCSLSTWIVNSRDYETIAKLKVKGIADWFTEEEKSIMKNKRIRKEVRDMSSQEWEKVSNAMNIMKYTMTDEGQSLYGENYYSYDELVCWHTMTAFSYNGDYGHGLPHFGIWHRAFMLLFEKAILSVDSSIVAFPYWDYRLDADNPRGSEWFSEAYIGNLMGDSDNGYAISNGPFAYWPVAYAKDVGCENYGNVFGLMRERVNPNYNIYVTRIGESFCGASYNSVGQAEDWETCLEEDEYVDFVECYEGSVHGGTHLGVGGTTERYVGKDVTVDRSGINFQKFTWCHTWLSGEKIEADNKVINRFWGHSRNNCLICPSCDLSEVSDDAEALADCVCKLTDDFEENGCMLDNPNNYLEQDYTTTSLNSHLIEHIWGDMLDAISSPNDPIFFFHHFNMDRYTYLWQFEKWDLKPYYGYPESGYEYGNNLYDVSSPERPFVGSLFDESHNSDEYDSDQEMTIQNIFDALSFVNAPYIYEDVYEAIFADDSEYAQYMEEYENEISGNSNNKGKNKNENNRKKFIRNEKQNDVIYNNNKNRESSSTDEFNKIDRNVQLMIAFGSIFAFLSCMVIIRVLNTTQSNMNNKPKFVDTRIYGSMDTTDDI